MIYKISSLIIITLLYSCSNVDPNNDPNSLYETDGRYGVFVQDTIYATADTVVRGRFLNTSLSPKLSLGEYDGLSAGFELIFASLPVDSILVDSVYLKFTTLNSFGPNAFETVGGMMYRIIDTLDTDSVNVLDLWRNPTDNSIVTEVEPVNFNLQDSSETSILFPMDLFDDWRINSTENYGIYFHPTEEDVVVELGSRNSSVDPMLIYYTHIEDSVIADTLFPISDAPIYNYDEFGGTALNFDENKILVSSGVNTNMFLKFETSELPANAIFYSANVILTEDDSNPYENSENAISFLLRPLETITANEDDYIFSPDRAYSILSDEGFSDVSAISKTELSTDVIQEILNGTVNNEWFMIQFLNRNSELSVKRFWGTKADKSLSPKLIVKYLNANK